VGLGESLALSATVGIHVTARRGATRDTIVSTTAGLSLYRSRAGLCFRTCLTSSRAFAALAFLAHRVEPGPETDDGFHGQ
jgi:hypothetical protein